MTKRDFFNWISIICFIIGTLSMLSPIAASTLLTPWILFLLGNFIWLADSVHSRKTPYICVSSFFIVWDSLLIVSRIFGPSVLDFLTPLITIIEMLP